MSAVGWPRCFLLSEADLIVKMGDGGVQAQGSVGQPYFLTLDSRARGDGGQRVKLNLIPGFPPPRCHVYSSELQVPSTSGNSQKG